MRNIIFSFWFVICSFDCTIVSELIEISVCFGLHKAS
jgi:hypothetical protein